MSTPKRKRRNRRGSVDRVKDFDANQDEVREIKDVEKYVEQLTSDSHPVRKEAIDQLVDCGINAVPEFPKIVRHLSHEDWTVRLSALEAFEAVTYAKPTRTRLGIARDRMRLITNELGSYSRRQEELEIKLEARNVEKQEILDQTRQFATGGAVDEDSDSDDDKLPSIQTSEGSVDSSSVENEVMRALVEEWAKEQKMKLIIAKQAIKSLEAQVASNQKIVMELNILRAQTEKKISEFCVHIEHAMTAAGFHAAAVVATLEDEFSIVRETALRVILQNGYHRTFPSPIVKRFEDEDWGVRRSAIQIAGELAIADDAGYIAALTVRLTDSFPLVRAAAIRAMSRCGNHAVKVAPRVALCIQDRENVEVRVEAALFIGEVGKAFSLPAPYIMALVQLLMDRVEEVRQAAVKALGQLGLSAAEICAESIATGKLSKKARKLLGGNCPEKVPALLQHEQSAVRLTGCQAIGAMGACVIEILPNIQSILLAVADFDDNREVNLAAREALWRLGFSGFYIPVVLEQLHDKESSVRCAGVKILGSMGMDGAEHVEELVRLLRDEEWPVRAATAAALAQMGPAAAPHVDAIGECIHDESSEVRRACADVIASIGEPAVSLAEELVSLLHDSNEDARVSVTRAIGYLGPSMKQYVPALIEQLGDDSDQVQAAAVDSLLKLQEGTIDSILDICNLLATAPRASVRLAAVTIISKMDGQILAPKAEEILTFVRDAMEDKDNNVRACATDTVHKLSPLRRAGKMTDKVQQIAGDIKSNMIRFQKDAPVLDRHFQHCCIDPQKCALTMTGGRKMATHPANICRVLMDENRRGQMTNQELGVNLRRIQKNLNAYNTAVAEFNQGIRDGNGVVTIENPELCQRVREAGRNQGMLCIEIQQQAYDWRGVDSAENTDRWPLPWPSAENQVSPVRRLKALPPKRPQTSPMVLSTLKGEGRSCINPDHGPETGPFGMPLE